MKPRLVERKAFWLVAASLIRPRLVSPIRLEGEAVNPPVYRRSPPYKVWTIELEVDQPWRSNIVKIHMEGSGLASLDGRTYAGLDNAHTYMIIPGGRHRLTIEATPPTIHGYHRLRIAVDYVLVAGVELEAFKTGLRLLALYEGLSNPQDPATMEALRRLHSILEEARIDATPRQLVAASMILYDSNWSPWTPRKELPPPRFDAYMIRGLYGDELLQGDEEEDPRGVEDLARKLWGRVEEALEPIAEASRTGRILHLVAHSHIDTAWLWPVEEARRKVLRTNATVAHLAGLYPEMAYAQSPALHHKWLKEKEDLYAEVSRLAGEGRWIPLGGFLVEGDLQMVHGESLARQLLYGQLHYTRELGKPARLGWLPDNFGYPASLPQLLAQAGLKALVIQKILWNDTNKGHIHAFRWRGLDGTEIPVQVIPDNRYAYNAPAKPSHVVEYTRNYKGGTRRLVYPYGYGDGGGGPTIEMLEALRAARLVPGAPIIVHGGLDQLAEDLADSSLPVVEGELYLELHRGTYTVNQEIKRLAYTAEYKLRILDLLNSLHTLEGTRHPGSKDLWEKLLTIQFHDILPGSASREANREAVDTAIKLIREADRRIMEALDGLAPCGMAVVNPNPWPTSMVLEGPEAPGCQRWRGKCLHWIHAEPLGAWRAEPGEPPSPAWVVEEGDTVVLGNGMVRARIGPGDLVESLEYMGRETLEWGNRLEVHIDEPPEWDAWDVEKWSLRTYKTPSPGRPRATARGPLRACAGTTLHMDNGRVELEACIDAGSPALDIYARVEWLERGLMLRSWTKPRAQGRILFETPYGYIERSRRELEGPKFESPMLRWVAVDEDGRGLLIYSPHHHGIAYRQGELGLGIVKRPYFPDPWIDERVEARWSLIPYHNGVPWSLVYAKWSPPLLAKPRRCRPGRGIGVARIEPPVPVSTIKPAEEGGAVVLRLYNPTPSTRRVRIEAGARMLRRASILEEPREPIDSWLEIGPFKVETLITATRYNPAP